MRAVAKAQRATPQVSYTLVRRDTLVTGTTRTLTGKVIMQALPQDSVLGFQFWATQDGLTQELVYDGQRGYEIAAPTRTYAPLTQPSQIRQLLNQAGGRLVVPDLVALDTTKATSFSLAQDTSSYYLTMHYPDLPAYGVVHRCKEVTIGRQRLLPTNIRRHQVTWGKVQTLSYEVRDFKVLTPPVAFADLAFHKKYRQTSAPAPAQAARPTSPQPAPAFQLTSLTKQVVALADLRGQMVLLDFWEVWCGPCLEAMPKVQQLQEHYAGQGLHVYGITHEPKQLEVLKKLVASRGVAFPTLLGTAASKQAYQLAAVPLYVVIDRQGIVRYRHEGFSPDLEAAIQQALRE